MDELIAKLESAEQGSRELDRDIAEAVGYKVQIIRVPEGHPVFKEGGGLEFMERDGVKVGIPPYSTSLDAKLPWENIQSLYAFDVVEDEPLGEGWEAWHVDRETGRRTMGAGNTEALARRVAALKAKQALR